MQKYRVTLKRKETIAEGIMVFYFDKPEGFKFKPGQFGEWALSSHEGREVRSFSIASSPLEPELMIATRMSDTAFKKSLREASLGAELELEGPYGSFVLHENHERSAIILTGGIGITPFRSIVVHAAEVGLPHKIFLFYTNRRPEEAAFLEELRELEGKNKNYRFIPTMTDVERLGASWAGERGRITAEMIHNAVGDISRAIYYIAGPAPMVAELWQMLVSCGVSPDDIRSEDFPGY